MKKKKNVYIITIHVKFDFDPPPYQICVFFFGLSRLKRWAEPLKATSIDPSAEVLFPLPNLALAFHFLRAREAGIVPIGGGIG